MVRVFLVRQRCIALQRRADERDVAPQRGDEQGVPRAARQQQVRNRCLDAASHAHEKGRHQRQMNRAIPISPNGIGISAGGEQ